MPNSIGLGMTTHWPEDLVSCVNEQLNLAVNELKPSACEIVCTLVLNSLHLAVSRQKSWLQNKVNTLQPERLCAYVNNLTRFAGLLAERGEMVTNALLDQVTTKQRSHSIDSVRSTSRKGMIELCMRYCLYCEIDSSDNLLASNKLEEGFKSVVKLVIAESRVGLKELLVLVSNDFRGQHGIVLNLTICLLNCFYRGFIMWLIGG